MATKNYEKLQDVMIKGEIHWACVHEPNSMTDVFDLKLIPDNMEEVKETGADTMVGFKDQYGNLRSMSQKDHTGDDGNPLYDVVEDNVEYVYIPSSKGAIYGPKVTYHDKTVEAGTKIGNGSKVVVKCDLARTSFGKKEFFKLKRPAKVFVTELVRFEGKSEDEEMLKAAGLAA